MLSVRDQVRDGLRRGLSRSAIAAQLGLANATVSYHARRLELAADTAEARPIPAPETEIPDPAIKTREQVAALLARGLRRTDIARELGVSKSTVSYHVRRLPAPVDARCARRYDWCAIQRYYDAGNSVRRCQDKFGFSRASWFDAVRNGRVVPRPQALPLDAFLREDTPRSRMQIKRRLISEGLRHYRCERCGLDSWRGRPISLALHHLNGKRDDNRLENLQLLCPNCHSQTGNFSGRARGSGNARRP